MKRKYYTGLLLATAGTLLTMLAGCEKVLENFDFLETDPRLVVNAPFIADSTILIHISHTVSILDDPGFTYTDNADAVLYQDGNLLSTATYLDSGIYTFDVIPLAGEVYTLRVSAPGYPSTEARVRMPELPLLNKIEYISWDEYGPRLDISIADGPEPGETYGFSIEAITGYFEYEGEDITDTIFGYNEFSYLSSRNINVTGAKSYFYYTSERWDDIIEGTTLLIEDDMVNGREFTVDIKAGNLMFPVLVDTTVNIYFESYDRDYLSFLKSMELYNNSDDNPFAEKVSIFSNIEGGLGVAYGKTITRTVFKFPPGARDDIVYPVW